LRRFPPDALLSERIDAGHVDDGGVFQLAGICCLNFMVYLGNNANRIAMARFLVNETWIKSSTTISKATAIQNCCKR